ncbi:MAG: 6-phosphofructokinase [Caldilineales bacterium]|nr:6-phosphofructokinase [Caldilineales bacterium]
MTRKKTLAVLTGGGDVPGLNPCIKQVVTRAIDEGWRVIGFRRGWAGPLNYNHDDPESWGKWVIELDKSVVRTIDRTGGTFLHTSRTHPSNVKPSDLPAFLNPNDFPVNNKGNLDCTAKIMQTLSDLNVDVLIPIGGDDTLSYGARLHNEGFPIVSIPKTMDNDVFGTDYCIGFSTAVTRSVELITNLRTSVGSHERIGIVELFGRNSGETSLISAYCANVDRAIISEVPFDVEKLARLLMEDKRQNPSNYCIMTISEGATMIKGQVVEYGEEDAYGHRKLGGIGFITAEAIKRLTGQNIIYQQLAYLMRSGPPDALDRIVAANFGSLAVSLATRGITGRMVALREGRYTHVAADYTTRGVKRVDVEEFYDVDQYRPKVAHVEGKPMFLY